MSTQHAGERAERQVALLLEERGFRILARNARLGRLEIDLIARRGDLVIFCEVRARTKSSFLAPVETINRAKVARIRRAAAIWLNQNPQGGAEVRFDAAGVVLERDPPEVTYYEAAF